MLWLNKMFRTGRRQDGFTVAEVAIAVLLMAISSIGLLGLFDSSLQLSGLARMSKDAKRVARTVSERIRAMPFYVPYANKDVDVDDFFWGTRAVITKNDNWDTPHTPPDAAPYVGYPQNIDPRYTCEVKMAYVKDDLTIPNMKVDWVPKGPAAVGGKDKPLSVNGDVFHILKYEVKVSWKAQLSGGRTVDKSESYPTLMSDTEFQADLGVSEIINTSTSSAQWGTGGQNSNTAPHEGTPNLPIKITGYGFKADQPITALLDRPGVDPIPIKDASGTGPVTRVDDNTLTGKVDLTTGCTGAPPWQPRRDPGKWTVRVDVGLAYAFASDAFTVEFPRPQIALSTPSVGYDNQGPGSLDVCLKTTGTKAVLNLGAGSSPYTSYTGATILLVKVEDPNVIIQADPDMPITYCYSLTQKNWTWNWPGWVSAYFDLRGAILGKYYVVVANCKNNRVTLKPGDVAAKIDPDPNSPTKTPIFTIRPYPTSIVEFDGLPFFTRRVWAITAGPDGNIWFTKETLQADYVYGLLRLGKVKPRPVGRLDPTTGTFTEYTAPPTDPDPAKALNMYEPLDITVGPDGNLWFTLSFWNHIGRMTTAGHCDGDDVFGLPTLVQFPQHITKGPDGNLWFTQASNYIGRITTAGNCSTFPMGSTSRDGRGITAGPDGNLWFCEIGENKIGRITPGLPNTITEFPIPTPDSGPLNITVGPDGSGGLGLWFTEFAANKIGYMDINGICSEITLSDNAPWWHEGHLQPNPITNRGPYDITAGPDGHGNIGIWFSEYFAAEIGCIIF